ncbi:Protein of unknown function [Nakamurella panacisegetis]|uniref:DUF4229 domain-containing protein n=1 Tax=Nakamurella panacisegetis TaxID=1090615 RepID=A0A1H0NSL9_9ACTN|nr:Protein of unknown function [Nakamurella panacisegetis]
MGDREETAAITDVGPDGREVPAPTGPPQLVKWLVLYTVLRIAMLVGLAAALSLVMPFILAALFAVLLALPLAWILFAGVRRRLNEAMAVSTAARRAERERLRSALNGEQE